MTNHSKHLMKSEYSRSVVIQAGHRQILMCRDYGGCLEVQGYDYMAHNDIRMVFPAKMFCDSNWAWKLFALSGSEVATSETTVVVMPCHICYVSLVFR